MTDDLYYRKLESTSTTDLVDIIRDKDKQIEELEKKNAELEETLGKCAKMPVLYCLGAKETITKAKELLKWWVNSYGYVDVALCNQTDQFLSEVEK